MKCYLQATEDNPRDLIEFDSAAWSRFTRERPFAVSVQGVTFSADWYCVVDQPYGCDVITLNDDPRWNPKPRADVWHFRHIAPDSNGAYNTNQTRIIYTDKPLDRIPANTELKPFSEFKKPRNFLEGLLVSDELVEAHVAAQNVKGWREWTDGVPEEEIVEGKIRDQTSLGRYLKPDGTRTFFLRDLNGPTDIHVANNELQVRPTFTTQVEVGSGSIARGTPELCYTFGTSTVDPLTDNPWPTGDYRIQLEVATAGGDVGYGLLTLGAVSGHFARIDNALTTDLETKPQIEAEQSGTGTKLLTTGSVSWSSGAKNDRYEALIAGINNATMGGPQTFELSIDFAGSFVDGPWLLIQLDAAVPLTLAVIADLGPPANTIDATVPLILTVDGDLKSTGELDAAPALILDVTADLQAPGGDSIDADVPLILSLAPDLTALGQLDAAPALILSIVADLTSAGQLDAAAALTLALVADLKAAGQLDAAAALAFAITGDLRAAGKLDAAIDLSLTVAADLTSSGSLDAGLAMIFTISADLQAPSADAIDADVALILSLAANLTSAGKVDAEVAMVFGVVADLKARGELDAAAALAFAVSADLRASGQVDAAVAMLFSVSASLAAAGKLDATAAMIFTVAADLKAVGQLDATAALVFSLSPDLQEGGDPAIDALIALAISVIGDLKSSGSLDATPALLMTLTADLRSVGTIAAAPALAFGLSPDLVAAGTLAASSDLAFSLAPDLTSSVSNALQASVDMALTLAPALASRGALLAALLIQFSVTANIVDGAGDPIPNSQQDLLADLLNSFQNLNAGA